MFLFFLFIMQKLLPGYVKNPNIISQPYTAEYISADWTSAVFRMMHTVIPS